jgi:hypothetical protein
VVVGDRRKLLKLLFAIRQQTFRISACETSEAGCFFKVNNLPVVAYHYYNMAGVDKQMEIAYEASGDLP